jgi:hypothetical protein
MLPLIVNSNTFIRKCYISTYWTKTCYMYFSSEKLQKDVICWLSVFVINVTFIMLHCKYFCYYYYNGEFKCVILLFLEWDVMYQTYHCLLPREQFSYSVVWWSIVPSSLARALCHIRQHIRRRVPSGVDNNRITTYIFSSALFFDQPDVVLSWYCYTWEIRSNIYM